MIPGQDHLELAATLGTLGVIRRTRKENERRLPIHPRHFDRIDANLRARIFLEQGYGNRFGVSDDHLARLVAGLRFRAEIIATTKVVLLPKPTRDDLVSLRRSLAMAPLSIKSQEKLITECERLTAERRQIAAVLADVPGTTTSRSRTSKQPALPPSTSR